MTNQFLVLRVGTAEAVPYYELAVLNAINQLGPEASFPLFSSFLSVCHVERGRTPESKHPCADGQKIGQTGVLNDDKHAGNSREPPFQS